jgi:hypothetical protein
MSLSKHLSTEDRPTYPEVSEQLCAEGATMIMLMGTILLGILVVGTAALTGHPVLIAVGGILAALILVATCRGRGRSTAC